MENSKINVHLMKGGTKCSTTECVIEEVIIVQEKLFQMIRDNPLYRFDIIADHSDKMYFDDEGTAHCVLICGKDCGDGLLINSDGYSYAKYFQYIPCGNMIAEYIKRKAR